LENLILTIGAPIGFGGKLIRTVSFFVFFHLESSESSEPVTTVGLFGGRGGGTLGCGFGSGFESSFIAVDKS